MRPFDWGAHTGPKVTTEGDHTLWAGPGSRWLEMAMMSAPRVPLTKYQTVVRTCEVDDCITHVEWVPCRRPKYPRGVCVYCGLPAGTRDHIQPRSWTGEAQRRVTVVVPACGECNSIIGDAAVLDIRSRRDYCHERLRKRLRRYLAVRRDPELEGALARRQDELLRIQEVCYLRLAWPDDPDYDERAWAR